jgi:formate-dependent phosphoribosylglycinamide formyltransferase (GAR transformylase)
VVSDQIKDHQELRLFCEAEQIWFSDTSHCPPNTALSLLRADEVPRHPYEISFRSLTKLVVAP